MLTWRGVRLRLAVWWWARLVPLLAYKRELKPLLQATAPADGRPYEGLAPAYIVRRAKRASRRPWFMRDRQCLREGLLAFRFLTMAGYRPILHFGVDRSSIAKSTLAAHCWVTIDGEVLLNPPDPNMVEILLYTGNLLRAPSPNRSSLASI